MGSAILFSKVGAVAREFPGFVTELQILLLRHGVEVNRCEAVGELAARLRSRSDGLRGDLRSMLGILFAEDREVSYLEVLGLLLAAAAGEDHAVLAYAPGLEEPVQELFSFVVEARPAREESFAGGFAEVERTERVEDGFGQGEPVDKVRGGGGGSKLAKALALAADGEAFGSGGPVRSFSSIAPRVEAEPVPMRWERPSEGQEGSVQRRHMYAVGGSGVLAGCMVGLLLGLPLGRRMGGPAEGAMVAKAGRGSADAGVDRAGERAAAAGEDARVKGGLPEEPAVKLKKAPEPAVDETLGKAGAAGKVDETPGKVGAAGEAERPRVEVGSAGIMAGNLLASPVPAYPAAATAARVEGEVVVSAVVGRDGSVVESRVVSGPGPLQEAARRAVEAWRYRPFEIGGKAVEIITTARVDFRLGGE